MINHPLIGRTLERADTGENLGVVAHIYGGNDDDYPWAVLVMNDGTIGSASLGPQSPFRVRMEPAPAEPYWERPGDAEPVERVKARAVKGDCASGDGTMYRLHPLRDGGVEVSVEGRRAFVPRADMLAALGLRGDL